MGQRPPVCIGTANRNQHHQKIAQSFLRKQLIHLLLINGIMSCSCIHIELPEVVEQGRAWTKLKMVTWTILSTNLLEVMLFHWCKKWESIPTWKTKDEEAVDCETSGVLTPTAPIFLASAELADTTTSRLLATWTSLSPTFHMRPLHQRGSTRTWHRPLSQWNGTQSHGLALPPLFKRKDWDKPMEDCCWACARDQFVQPCRQASLGGTTSLRPWRKVNSEVQTSPLRQEMSCSCQEWCE